MGGIRSRHPHRLSRARAARRWQRGLPRRAGGHGCATRFPAHGGEGACRHLGRGQAQSRHGGCRRAVPLDVCVVAPPRLHRPRHLRGQHQRRWRHRRRIASAAQDGGRLASIQPGRLPRVCIAPTLVPYAQRCVHDGELPRRIDVALESLEAQRAVVVPARAGRDLFGRLPPDRRGAGGHRRRRRRQGALRAQEVRRAGALARRRRRAGRPTPPVTPSSSSASVTPRRPKARSHARAKSRCRRVHASTPRDASHASCPCP